MVELQRYQYDLDNIPEQHKHIFIRANAKMKEAYENPGKLVFDTAGQYYFVFENQLCRIDHNELGWLVVHEYSGYTDWYSDPYQTLKEIKDAYGLNVIKSADEIPDSDARQRIDELSAAFEIKELRRSFLKSARYLNRKYGNESILYSNIVELPDEPDFELYVIDTGKGTYFAADAKTLDPFGKETRHDHWQSLTGFRKCKWITNDEWMEILANKMKYDPEYQKSLDAYMRKVARRVLS